jgi:hypothetical protein
LSDIVTAGARNRPTIPGAIIIITGATVITGLPRVRLDGPIPTGALVGQAVYRAIIPRLGVSIIASLVPLSRPVAAKPRNRHAIGRTIIPRLGVAIVTSLVSCVNKPVSTGRDRAGSVGSVRTGIGDIPVAIVALLHAHLHHIVTADG